MFSGDRQIERNIESRQNRTKIPLGRERGKEIAAKKSRSRALGRPMREEKTLASKETPASSSTLVSAPRMDSSRNIPR